MRLVTLAILAVSLAACSNTADDGVVDVAFISEAAEIETDGVRLDYAGQHVRAALSTGLVRTDARGQVVPGVAERWIVTDDGASYIFRINEFDLPDGTRLTAQEVRSALQRRLRQLRGTSLGLDLAKIRDIRAMTGRVVEIRLVSPMPDFLQLLAQPEMGIDLDRQSAGLMTSADGDGALLLAPLAPERRGLPEQPGWVDQVHALRVEAVGPQAATEGFSQGRYDLVLGGRLATLPLASAGPLSRGNVRLDAAIGLLGLDVRRPQGFLSESANREALAMAIDRPGLIQPFNVGGWLPSTRIVPTGLWSAPDAPQERWPTASLDQRRSEARQRVAQWRAASGQGPQISVYLSEGPGSQILYEALVDDFAAIGVTTARAETPGAADIVLRDRVARYASARWFLNQFACEVRRAQCSEDADYLVSLALEARDASEEASYLLEAENTLLASNLYIPLGAPVRWSLVRADIEAFSENPWAIHPLFPLSRAPI